jgi:hypothetical protein
MLARVGPVLKSRASSPSHVRGLNRPVEAVVETQLSGPKQQTHTIARQPFSHKSFAPLLRGHHPEGRLGLAVLGIASPSDGVGKLANYYCSADGTRPGCRKKQIISSALSSIARFPLSFLLFENVLTIRLPNRLLKIRSGVATDEDLPVEH